GLNSIIIPNSVTSMGEKAFLNCGLLSSVIIGNSVETIENSTFVNCPLSSISIPDSVESIGEMAFMNCQDLSLVIIGNSVETIGGKAFECCSNLNRLTIETVIPPVLGNDVFSGTSTSDFKIYVPSESVETYKNADGWKDYKDNIIAIE
ncbi:MAG: leucine-rich repeat domain-containing protein, partial [Sphaerochaetaceae bacterium]|nr:leucine-rich repeat domain-containing protein [Sphaerochaetaceae bacterium]